MVGAKEFDSKRSDDVLQKKEEYIIVCLTWFFCHILTFFSARTIMIYVHFGHPWESAKRTECSCKTIVLRPVGCACYLGQISFNDCKVWPSPKEGIWWCNNTTSWEFGNAVCKRFHPITVAGCEPSWLALVMDETSSNVYVISTAECCCCCCCLNVKLQGVIIISSSFFAFWCRTGTVKVTEQRDIHEFNSLNFVTIFIYVPNLCVCCYVIDVAGNSFCLISLSTRTSYQQWPFHKLMKKVTDRIPSAFLIPILGINYLALTKATSRISLK